MDLGSCFGYEARWGKLPRAFHFYSVMRELKVINLISGAYLNISSLLALLAN